MPSQVIAGFSYDAVTGTLFVRFQSGELYAYLEVEEAVVESFGKAASKGRYFMGRIRNRYPFRRIPPNAAAGEMLWPRPRRAITAEER
jgi:hypothetical protein